MAVFSYLVSCPETKEALIIDPGGDVEKLADRVKEKGLTLKYIVNTHAHADHSCGNGKLEELTGAKLVVHEMCKPLLESPMGKDMYYKLGYAPSPSPDMTVKDGDELVIGNVSMKVLHTPGHSPGGICLLCQGNLFTGDTLFVGGIGRTDLPGSDHVQFIASLREKLLTLPDETVVWPGHDYGPNPSSTIGLEKVANPWIRQMI